MSAVDWDRARSTVDRPKLWSQLTPEEKGTRVRLAIAEGHKTASEIGGACRTTRRAIIGVCFRQKIVLPNARRV